MTPRNSISTGRCPTSRKSNASKSGRERVIARARRDNLTVRDLARIAGSYGGLALVGTPSMIADQMEEWLFGDACDGFNIMFPWVPGGLDEFVDRVVPELQRRRPLPPRIRRQDPARKPRPPPPRKPLFREARVLTASVVGLGGRFREATNRFLGLNLEPGGLRR